jgi:lysozyme
MKKHLLIPILLLPFCQTPCLPKGNGTIDPSLFPDKEVVYKERKFRPLIIQPATSKVNAADLITQFEGFKPTPYLCSAGKKTIGYGFTQARYVSRGRMTESEAREILNKELIPYFENLVETNVRKPLTPNQKAALISFSFNLGEEPLKKIAERINKGNFNEAANAIKLYTKVKKGNKYVQLQGLVDRREKEARLFDS